MCCDQHPTSIRHCPAAYLQTSHPPPPPPRARTAALPTHKQSSQMVVFDGCPDDRHHPSSMPIYQTSTFVQPSSTEYGSYDYTRSGNPTRTALEKQVALLEGA